jgi:tol-pal system protein YbgF
MPALHVPGRAALRAAAAAALLMVAAGSTQAGLFSDDEARKAILDLRARLDQMDQANRAREAELATLRRSLLDLNTTIEQLRTDLARQRGGEEQLARDVAELQRKQKDVQQGIDERLRRMEPQKVSLDGQEFLAEPEETKAYGDAVGVLRQGDFAGAATAFGNFQRRWPASGYTPAVLYWLGNAQYGLRQYKEAIATFKSLLATAPDHPRAPEAMLSIANCQIELKDNKAARVTLQDLNKLHPQSEAAQAGRQRLAALK